MLMKITSGLPDFTASSSSSILSESELPAVRAQREALRGVRDELTEAIELLRVRHCVTVEERIGERVSCGLRLGRDNRRLQVVRVRVRAAQKVVHISIATHDLERRGALVERRCTLRPRVAHCVERGGSQRGLLVIRERGAGA